jgi:DNA-binding MarR family transcriptional regulator
MQGDNMGGSDMEMSDHDMVADHVESPTELRKPLGLSVTHLLHRACQVADIIFAEEGQNIGLTPRQYAVLVSVAHNRDISQTGLVHVTGIDRSTLAEIVKRLIGKKLLKRRRTRLDARTYAVRLTDEGVALLKSVEPAAERADKRLLEMLQAPGREALMSSLSELVAAMPEPR